MIWWVQGKVILVGKFEIEEEGAIFFYTLTLRGWSLGNGKW